MDRFSLCTATSEQDYFCFPASKPQESQFVSEFDPVLKKRDLVWRSPVAADLSFSLVSRSGEVTFSAGPLKSGREDKIGRPICNYVTVWSSNADDKRSMGRIFAALLASGDARDKFAEQLETQIVQPYLKNTVWDGRLPEFEGCPVAGSGLPDASQKVYPKDGLDAGKCAGYISELVESCRDFAVGVSVYPGDRVAEKLQEVYSFVWSETYIAVFSKAALFPAPLPRPGIIRHGPEAGTVLSPIEQVLDSLSKIPKLFLCFGLFVVVVVLCCGLKRGCSEPPTPHDGFEQNNSISVQSPHGGNPSN